MSDLLTLDVEQAFADFLRTQTSVTALVGPRVYVQQLPPAPTWPLVVVRRIAGGLTVADGPEDNPTLQVDCWAIGPNRTQASLLARTVVSVLPNMRGADHRLGAYTVSALAPSLDPNTGRARVSLDLDLYSYPEGS